MEVPENFEYDVSALQIGESAPACRPPGAGGRDLLDDLEETVLAAVGQPTRVEEPEDVLAEGEEPATAGRPRVSSRRRRASRPPSRTPPLRAAKAPPPADAPAVAPGRTRLVARPARRGPRQSRGASTRANRHNVGWMVVDELAAAPRRLVAVEVRRPHRRHPYRRAQGGAVEAGDVHERLGQGGQRGVRVLQGRARRDPGRARRERSRARPPPGTARRRSRRSQRPQVGRSLLGTQDFLRLRVGVGRPGRGDPRPLADYVLSDFEPHDDADALVARAADAVETLDADGLEAAQQRFN